MNKLYLTEDIYHRISTENKIDKIDSYEFSIHLSHTDNKLVFFNYLQAICTHDKLHFFNNFYHSSTIVGENLVLNFKKKIVTPY